MKRNVFVIGLDGATFDLVKPWVEDGKLPTFGKLMRGGVYGELKSVIPPTTIPAWQCFMTGKNPGKLGVFDFTRRNFEGEYSLYSWDKLKSDSILDILDREGRTIISLNLHGTYPPKKIRGCIVPGLFTPGQRPVSYPKGLADEIVKKFGYITVPTHGNNLKNIAQRMLDVEERRRKTSFYLMDRYDFDFHIIVFQITDIMVHHCWGDKKEMLKAYQGVDKIVGEYVKRMGKEDILIIMSDHGGGPIYKLFHLDSWLEKEGYLKLRRGKTEKEGIPALLSRLGITQENLYIILKKLHLLELAKIYRKRPVVRIPRTNKVVDWENTKAYFWMTKGPCVGVNINLKGRERDGIVDEKDYESLREEIIQKLQEIGDPETGENIFEKIYKKEEIYHGDHMEGAPDIMLYSKDLKYMLTHRVYGDSIISESAFREGKGIHRENGIFIAYGLDIAKGREIYNAELIDITPTILYIMGIPIPDDMDGKVLKDIFEKNSNLAKKSVGYQKTRRREILRARVRELKLKKRI